MQKSISTKALYSHLKKIGEEVSSLRTTYVVLKHSRPIFKIVPLEENGVSKKYKVSDIDSFTFSSVTKKEKSLATNYKKYIYTPPQ